AEKVNLYEWSAAEGIRLVNKLPNNSVVSPNDVVGFGRASICQGAPNDILRNAISDDGTKAFWATTAGLYARLSGMETVQLDLKQGGPGPSGGGQFIGGSRDGSQVFFTSSSPLTLGAASGDPGDLY